MASGAQSIVNLSAFSSTELNQLLVAAKAALLAKITGQVQAGSSTGQSYQMELLDPDQLSRLINAITAQLGLDGVEVRVRPNFTGAFGYDTAWSSTGVPANPSA